MIQVRQLFNSVKHAIRGVRVVFRSEQNFRIQLIAGFAVLGLTFFVPIARWEFIVLMLLIGSVLSLELINSVFERIIDTFKPRIHPIVRDIKDIMAATVLVTSLIALVVGLSIFVPHLLPLV